MVERSSLAFLEASHLTYLAHNGRATRTSYLTLSFFPKKHSSAIGPDPGLELKLCLLKG